MKEYTFNVTASRPAADLPASPGVERKRVRAVITVMTQDKEKAKTLARNQAEVVFGDRFDHIRVRPYVKEDHPAF